MMVEDQSQQPEPQPTVRVRVKEDVLLRPGREGVVEGHVDWGSHRNYQVRFEDGTLWAYRACELDLVRAD